MRAVPRPRAVDIADLPVERVPLATLRPDPKNARRHGQQNLDAIRKSLEAFGQRRPLVTDKTGRTVIAGNGTLEVMASLGWETAWVTRFPGTAAQARAFAVADNRTAELAEWDLSVLTDTLGGFDDDLLAASGFDHDHLADLLSDHVDAAGVTGGSPVSLTDPDDLPATPKRVTSQVGDVWLLGPHRVFCGDSREEVAVRSVIAGAPADVMWTDPPYGVDYVGKTKDALTIQNDGGSMPALDALLRGIFGAALVACKPGAAWYVAAPAGPQTLTFATVLADMGVWRQTLVWVKNAMVLGHSDYHYRHENIYLGYAPGCAGRLGRGGARWFGDNSQTTVIEIDKPSRSEDHPTMKPTALIVHCLKNSAPPGGIVYDACGGSGSTLIAAHQIGLSARLIELDPRYVDVICRRWQQHTGVVPVLEATGAEHDFL